MLNRDSGFGTWAERTIQAIGTSDHPRWHVVLTIAAYGRFHRGAVKEALEVADAALTLSRERGDLVNAAWTAMCQANLAAAVGDIARTLEVYSQLLEFIPEDTYDALIVDAIFSLYLGAAGQDERSRKHAKRALDRGRAAGQPSALAIGLYAHAMAVSHEDPLHSAS